jgi:hypothetical protein
MNQAAAKIQLLKNKDDNIITPFYIPDFQEIKSGKSNNSVHLFFEITAPQNSPDGLSVSIYSGERLIYSAKVQSNTVSESKITWKWDGFSRQGIFDSKLLKNMPLTVQLEANNNNTPVHKIELQAKHAEEDWDDIKIVYNTNGEWMRSSNPGSVRGVYSLFGNFVPEQIVYNVGWLEFSNG